MHEKTRALLRQSMFIGGEWQSAASAETIAVTDPASGEPIGTVPYGGAPEAAKAISAALNAMSALSQTTAAERAAMLRGMHGFIEENADYLAELLTREQGKPLAEARAEISSGAGYILWFAEEARRIEGRTVPSPWRDRRIIVTHEPVGVVGAITPWNFPFSMIARKLGPALAAGCPVVVKPAIQTPFSGLVWGEIANAAGLPAGALNVITGGASEIGKCLTGDERVRKITFTGSTAVGKHLLAECAPTVKKVSMELGGNAPFIVFNDADIDRAVAGAVAAKFRNSGQTCVCTNRFYVQDSVHAAFVDKLAVAADALKVAPGMEAGSEQGPLIDDDAVANAEALVVDAREKGAQILAGGRRHERAGRFFAPTVIANARADMRMSSEEIFAPIAPIYRFTEEDEVIAAANATPYGLAAYAYTRDLGRAFRVMEQLEYGLVGINEGMITTPEAPFGGIKQSGMGSEGGREGIHEYLAVKYACVGGLDG